VVLNDPGRLLAVHLMHTALVSGWAGSMAFYEIRIFDPLDPILNPMWRQGMFLMPFMTRLGVTKSWRFWSVIRGGLDKTETSFFWSYESVALAHIALSGLLFLAAVWHWFYWQLEIFQDSRNGEPILDLPKIFGIHLLLASTLCFCFGTFHIRGLFGPGIWVSDTFGISGDIQKVSPVWGRSGFRPLRAGGIASHHIAAGLFGLMGSLFHLRIRPPRFLYSTLRMGNIETALSSSIAAVFFASFIVSGTMWYGRASTPVELFGPTRYQ